LLLPAEFFAGLCNEQEGARDSAEVSTFTASSVSV
jgi:hypothetical protein